MGVRVILEFDKSNRLANSIMKVVENVGVFKIKYENESSENLTDYNPEIIEKINRGIKQKEAGKTTVIKTEDLWK
ncbi:MAG TPA: hypothetical protein PKH79_09240 [Prolixibacteraceae bacterium]|nr:hypothetical protein [Prolixibacteraceae bacterium]